MFAGYGLHFNKENFAGFLNSCFVSNISFNLLLQAITSTGIKKGDLLLGDVSTQLKNKNITTDVKVDTNSNVSKHPLLVTLPFTVLVCKLVAAMTRN